MNKVVVHEEPVKQLTAAEGKRKAQLEQTIIKYSREFLEVGMALAEIQERRLYRVEHKTFDAYIKQAFELAPRTAYQYISASEAYENLRNCAENDSEVIELLPANEAQLRPLTKLPAQQQRVVWQMAVESAPGGKVTAKHIDRTAKQYLGETATKAITKRKAQPAKGRKVEDGLHATYAAFMESLKKTIDGGYSATTREAVIGLLDDLIAIREVVAMGSDLEELRGFEAASSADANKLEKAGYLLFRMDRSSMNIKERAGGGWPKHSGSYKTVKAMEDAFATLLKDDKHLRG